MKEQLVKRYAPGIAVFQQVESDAKMLSRDGWLIAMPVVMHPNMGALVVYERVDGGAKVKRARSTDWAYAHPEGSFIALTKDNND